MPILKSDPRVKWWVDGREPFASNTSIVNTHMGNQGGPANNVSYRNIPETGLKDSSNNIVCMRVPDPTDPTQTVIRLRHGNGWPTWGGLWKTEILASGNSGDGQSVRTNQSIWFVLAFALDADATDYSNIFDFHNGDNPPSQGVQIAFSAINCATNGVGSSWYIDHSVAAHNPTQNNSDRTTRRVVSMPMRANEMNYLVGHLRMSPNAGDNPFSQYWVKQGTGTLQKVHDEQLPIGYVNHDVNQYQKFGVYCITTPSGTQTQYYRGFVILRDEPGTPTLNADEVLAIFTSSTPTGPDPTPPTDAPGGAQIVGWAPLGDPDGDPVGWNTTAGNQSSDVTAVGAAWAGSAIYTATSANGGSPTAPAGSWSVGNIWTAPPAFVTGDPAGQNEYMIKAYIHPRALGATNVSGQVWTTDVTKPNNVGNLLFNFVGLNISPSLVNGKAELIIPVPAGSLVGGSQNVRVYMASQTFNTPIFSAAVLNV